MEVDISHIYKDISPPITPEELRGFSVREIGILYGSQGLDIIIDQELQRLNLYSDPAITFARKLAYRLHKDDPRSDGGSCNDHLRRTMLRLIRDMGITDPARIAGMVMHDGVEDHADEIFRTYGTRPSTGDVHRDALIALEPHMPELAIYFIDKLSYPKFPKGPARLPAYAHQTELTLRCPVVQPGKLSDFIDNAVENDHTKKPSLQLRLDAKQLACYDLHIDGLMAPNCQIAPDKQKVLLAQLEMGREAAALRLCRGRGDGQLDTDMWQTLVMLNPWLEELMVH